MLRGMIFDCDGTLLDTMPDLAAVTNQTLTDFGFPTHTFDEIQSYVGDGGRRLINLAVPEGTAPEVCEEAFQHWCALYPQIGFKLTEHYDGMDEAIATLQRKDCKLAVLSNKFNEATKLVIDRNFPTGTFNPVYGERAGVPRKPDPTGLRGVIKEMGLEPAECAYVGDAPTDIEVALRAGAYAIGVSWGYREEADLVAAGAQAIAHEPADFVRIFDSLQDERRTAAALPML
jgi:phosphoglycolate phosphatase